MMPVLMFRLHGNLPQYHNRSKFLFSHDISLAPSLTSNTLDKRMSEVVCPPLGKLCTLQVVAANVSGTWSHFGTCGLALSRQSLSRYVIPAPSTAADILHIDSTHSSPSAIKCAGDVATHPSVAHTLQTFRTGFSKGIQRAVRFATTSSPVARPSKRPRTPFPVNKTDSDRNTPEGHTRSLAQKRSRTALPQVGVPPLTPHAVVSGKEEVQGDIKTLRPLAQWLTGYIYFLISNADRASSRAPCLVDFPEQEVAMSKILDILVHYHPDNTITFLAVWYLVALFPKALVMSRDLLGQDAVELISRLFLLGLTLASKWLSDCPMSLKNWSHLCSLTLSSILELERSALAILDHNISISNTDWVSWLVDVRNSASYYPPLCSDKVSVVAFVNSLLKVAPKVSGQHLDSRPKPIARPASFQLSSNLYAQVIQGLQAVPKLPAPMPLYAISEPAPWDPANDPIIARVHGRTNGTAPGAVPCATAAVDLLAAIPTNDGLPESQHF